MHFVNYPDRDDMLYSFICTRIKGDNMSEFHSHDGYEIYYVSSGCTEYYIGDKRYTLTKGDIIIIPPFVEHRCIYPSNERTYRMELNVKKEFLDNEHSAILNRLAENVLFEVSGKYSDRLKKLFQLLNDEQNYSRPFSDIMTRNYFSEILIILYRYSHPCTDFETKDSMQKAVEYISEHYSESLSVSDMAELLHMSERSFMRGFKNRMHMNFTEFVTHTRIEHAAEMLVSGASVPDAAFSCGFNDSNYFSRVFKKYKGVSPKKYIAENKK